MAAIFIALHSPMLQRLIPQRFRQSGIAFSWTEQITLSKSSRMVPQSSNSNMQKISKDQMLQLGPQRHLVCFILLVLWARNIYGVHAKWGLNPRIQLNLPCTSTYHILPHTSCTSFDHLVLSGPNFWCAAGRSPAQFFRICPPTKWPHILITVWYICNFEQIICSLSIT